MPCIPSHYAVCSALRWVASMDRGERTLRAEELAGDVQGLASHNDDLLAVEQLLGDRGSCGFLVCARRGILTITGSNVDMAMICLDLLVSEEESGG
jgi:hypothetical protein